MNSHRHSTAILAVVVSALSVFCSALSSAQGPAFDVIGRFSDGKVELMLATVPKPRLDPTRPLLTSNAIVSLEGGPKASLFQFDERQAAQVLGLWQIARDRSSDTPRRIFGRLAALPPSKATLLFSAGPGVRVSILDPSGGGLSFDLLDADVARFHQNLIALTDRAQGVPAAVPDYGAYIRAGEQEMQDRLKRFDNLPRANPDPSGLKQLEGSSERLKKR